MKRLLIPLALAIALVVPAQAGAKSKAKHYVGAVSPSGSLSFNVVQQKHSKEKSVKGFSFSNVPVTCAEGPATANGVVSFPVKLSGGSFNINASSTSTGAALRASSSVFSGTIHVTGNVPLDSGVIGSDCDSGVLSWTAQRG